MNIKNTVTLSDPYLRCAEELVENGQFPSVEKVLEAGLDNLMQADELTPEANDAVMAMADEIRGLLETPADQWISMDEDNLFDRVRARIAERKQAD